MSLANEYIAKRLAERQSAGAYRSLKPENDLIDFCSNDYLGFARSGTLSKSIQEEINNNTHISNGATGSRLISGNLTYTEDLERMIAGFHDSEAGLLFNSGYDANIGLFSSLPQRGDTIITDELIHASIIDGVRLSHANRYTFKHNDVGSLEEKLQHAKGICYVIIESVYSMDGDSPPFLAILLLIEKYNAQLIVDEAHAVGLYKQGLICHLNLQKRVFARVVTFGKALGCHGAVVLGSNVLREYLINFARSFIYTTAAPFHQLATIKMAYSLLQDSDETVDQLQQNIQLFNKTMGDDLTMIKSQSAIHCLLLNSNENAKAAALLLQNKGLDVRAILSPTVPLGSERIRICLHAFNTNEQITLLTTLLTQIQHA